jgi:hypothetical protein
MSTTPTNGVYHASDEAIDQLYAWMRPAPPAPAPCPEAAFSLTLKGTLDGQEALLTARGMTAAEFKDNLRAIRGLLDPPPAPPGSQDQDWCPVHQVTMQGQHKNGHTWFSHRLTDGTWCKGASKGR